MTNLRATKGPYEALDEKLKAIGALSMKEQMGATLGKYSFHTGVHTIEDVLWMVETNLREALFLKNSILLEFDGIPSRIPDDHELFDFVSGRCAALKEVYIHLKRAVENSTSKSKG